MSVTFKVYIPSEVILLVEPAIAEFVLAATVEEFTTELGGTVQLIVELVTLDTPVNTIVDCRQDKTETGCDT